MFNADLVVGAIAALGGLAAAGAAWWTVRVALRIAAQDRTASAAREARSEAWSLFNARIDKLLALMTVAERAAQEGGAWVEGEARRTGPRLRAVETPENSKDAGAATAELRALLLLTREYLPLSRSLLIDGMPFSAGDASAPFEALLEELDAESQSWFGLELNDIDPIGLQVVRAEILLTLRGLERAAKSVAVSTVGDASVLTGWDLDLK